MYAAAVPVHVLRMWRMLRTWEVAGGKIPLSHHVARTIFGTNPQLNHWDGGASVLTSPRAPQTHQDGRALSPLSRTKSPRSKT